MTYATGAHPKGVIPPSQSPRTVHTVRFARLMEERQRLEIAERIRQLRERSRWNQPQIAEKLGLSLRGYQKVEERGTTKFERVEAIAKIHGADPNWIWEGEKRGETPDVFAGDGHPRAGDQWLELILTEILDRLDLLEAELAATLIAQLGETETPPDEEDVDEAKG